MFNDFETGDTNHFHMKDFNFLPSIQIQLKDSLADHIKRTKEWKFKDIITIDQ